MVNVMQKRLELIGDPEVSRSGLHRKAARAKEPKGKLVSVKVSHIKTQLLQGLTHSKTALLAGGLAYFWEDVAAYADPTQIHLVWVLTIVAVAEVLTFKFSKIQ
jgi:hypothetical protein